MILAQFPNIEMDILLEYLIKLNELDLGIYCINVSCLVLGPQHKKYR